jgi:hypothetical protein
MLFTILLEFIVIVDIFRLTNMKQSIGINWMNWNGRKTIVKHVNRKVHV